MKPLQFRRGFTLLELLVVFGILAVVIGLTIPAVMRVRDAAARSECQNNLRQIGLALHGYHDTYAVLPPGVRSDGSYPWMSWMARILPFVEQNAAWQQTMAAFEIDPDFRNDPPHPFAVVMPTYGCPADSRTLQVGLASGRLPVAFTSYLGVEGKNQTRHDGCLYLNSGVSFSKITDGTSNTLLVGERPPSADGIFGWWYGGQGQSFDGSADMVLGVRERNTRFFDNCPPGPSAFGPGKLQNQCDLLHFWSLHLDGANFAFADGSVHFLHYSAAPLMPALASCAGGEAVSLPD